MSKMSQLSAELDELRRCGEILIGISETLREMFSAAEDGEQEEPAGKTAKKPAAGKTKAKNEEAAPEDVKKVLTLEDVRIVLAEKSRVGFTEEIRAIIKRHGADRLSDVDPAEYEAVIAETEVLKDA